MQKATKIGDQWLVFGGGGLILALTTTEPAIVPVRAVLWLDDESTA
jgi:hypothetical protein